MVRKLIPVLIMMILLAGCASTPRQQYANVNDAYIAAVQTLIDAKQADVFTDEEWNQDILPLLNLGDALLDEHDAATEAGLETDSVAHRLRDVLIRLKPYIARAVSDTEGD